MTSPIPPRRTGLGRRVADIVGESGLIPEGTDGPRLLPGPEVVPLDAVPLAMLVADRGGRVQAVNDRWVQVSGLTRGHSLGSGWLDVLPDAERASFQAVVDQVAAGGPARRLDYSWVHTEAKGRATWFLTSIVRAGETLVGITVDVHSPAAAAGVGGSGVGAAGVVAVGAVTTVGSNGSNGAAGPTGEDLVRVELVGLLHSVDALLATLDRVVDRLPVLELDVVPA